MLTPIQTRGAGFKPACRGAPRIESNAFNRVNLF